MVHPRKTIPNHLYTAENMYTFSYFVAINEFKKQLSDIKLGDTLYGPLIKDDRRQYGKIEFLRVMDDGWIVTLRKEFEGSADLTIWTAECIIVDTKGFDQSDKLIQAILTAKKMKSLDETQHVNVQVRISEDHIAERCHTACQISRLYKDQLLCELEEIFTSGLFADFTLVVAGEEIRAHKNILAASSEYFKSEMIESETDCLEVNDSKPSTIRAVLEYIYTGQVRKPDFVKLGLENYEDVDFYTDLLIAADMYQLEDLKSFCEGCICNLVNGESLVSLMSLTSRFNLEKLRKNIAKFASSQLDGCNTREIEEIEEVGKLRRTIPDGLYKYEGTYTHHYEANINGFKKQLSDIKLGDTLHGPLIKDERRQYGQIEFKRARKDGWIVTLRKEFEWSGYMNITKNGHIVTSYGSNQSGKVIQAILLAEKMENLDQTQNVNVQVRISEDRFAERCQNACQISRLYKEQLLSELEKMLESGLFADFTLVVSGEEIRAHKNILAASSEYFAALLKSEMIESRTNRLEINDSKPSTVRAVLGYIYTNEVKVPNYEELGLENYEDVDFYTDLLIAADMYQLEDLKSFCEGCICNLVNGESLVSLMSLTSRFNLEKLRKSIVKFASNQLDVCGKRKIMKT